jgi:hypothetical protein
MTVNDPKVYTGPWTLRLPIPREQGYGAQNRSPHKRLASSH